VPRLGALEFIGLLADGGTRETVPGVTSDEIQHATATDLVIDIDCTAGELRTINA
jgi:hypothetical protein